MLLPLAEHVFQSIRDMRFSRPPSRRGDAAVAQPVMPAIGSCAIEDHIRFRGVLAMLVIAQQETERCRSAPWIIRWIASEQASTADGDDVRLEPDALAKLPSQ